MSISRKNKRWYVQIDVPAGPDGKRRRRGVGGFKTKREAKAAEAEALRRLKEQTFVEPSRVLVREYLTTWLAGMANQVRPTTLDGYRHQVRAPCCPSRGVRLQQLTTTPLNQLYAELAERGGKDGQPLAPKTVRLAHTVIRRALRGAMADGLVARNVAAQARPPRARPVEMGTWTAEEVGAFLASVREHRLYGAWLLLATLGLRRGELVGLRWQDVDLNAGRIAVRRTLVMVSRKPALAEPKTAKGRRSITLAPGRGRRPAPPPRPAGSRAAGLGRRLDRLGPGRHMRGRRSRPWGDPPCLRLPGGRAEKCLNLEAHPVEKSQRVGR